MDKKRIAVLFGGKSSEHDISCISAKTVANALPNERYAVYTIYIDKAGKWFLWNRPMNEFAEAETSGCDKVTLLPADGGKAALMVNGRIVDQIDVVIPVMHGKNGEDGTMQGFLEIIGVPYVGCGVLASAVSMDKLTTKHLVDTIGIRQAKFVAITGLEINEKEAKMDEAEAKFGYPMFVKPCNAGSSIGVSKAEDREGLSRAIDIAAAEDNRILIEEAIFGREVETAVLGNLDPKVAGPGEVLAADSFYSFDAKYTNAESKTVTNPVLPDGVAEELRADAAKIFRAVDGRGLSRVDFFVENGTNEVVFNEINTFPGFTGISMYPMLWAAAGLGITELVEALIALAEEDKR